MVMTCALILAATSACEHVENRISTYVNSCMKKIFGRRDMWAENDLIAAQLEPEMA
jgi:hypothetical protein